jgi:hypothetical protein
MTPDGRMCYSVRAAAIRQLLEILLKEIKYETSKGKGESV